MKKEPNRTKQELMRELNQLRTKIGKLEKSESELKNIEKALRESEALYSALFQNNPIQTVVVDKNGRVIAYNRQKEVSGDRLPAIGDIMYKDYAAKHQIDMHSELIKCIRNGKMGEFPELKYEGKILNIKIAPFKNGAIITSIDITENKKNENDLRFSEIRYRTLQENIPIGVYRVSPRGRFISINPALVQMLGYETEQDLLGKNVLRLYHSPKKRDELLNFLERDGSIDNFECQVLCKDNSAMWQSFSVKAVRDEHGKILHYDGVSKNINERKKFEKELLRITKAVESTSEAIGICDDQGKNFYQNKAFNEMFGYNIEEFNRAGGVPVLFKEGDIFFRDIAKKESWTGMVNMVSKDGRDLIIYLRTDTIKDDDGEIIGQIGVHSDITEQKRLEEDSRKLQEQVQHTQKLESLGILAGGIAHDFNNLLLGILGNADLALLEIPQTLPARKNIMDIITITQRAAELCRQMLAYSGKGRFIKESIDLSRLVEEIGHLLEVSISKNVILKYDLKESLPFFDADATQIRQIIMNLITNASDAIGGQKGIITIRTGILECDGKYLDDALLKNDPVEGVNIFLEVSDTGCGMDEETKKKIFDPFFSTKLSGRGLGLAVVMGIIRSHRGACKVTSTVGQGTIFRILFPVSESN